MELKLIERKTSDSVREYVYKTLRNNIMLLDLKPGTNITEKDVAEKLEVSRTPVREALLKLSQEDLLDIYPQKGTVVSLIDVAHVEEAMFIRKNLEIAVVKSLCTEFPENLLFELHTNLNSMEFHMNQNQFDPIKIFYLDEDFHKLIFKGSSKMKAWSVIKQASTHLNRVRLLKVLTTNNFWDGVLRQHTDIVNSIKDKDINRSVQVLEEHLGSLDIQLEKLRSQYSTYFS